MNKDGNKKLNTTLLIVIIILLLAVVGLLGYFLLQPHDTAIIEKVDAPTHDTSAGTVRITMERSLVVKSGTIQNLNFTNYNENRLMSVKLYTAENKEIKELIYESPMIETSETIKGDLVNTKLLQKGQNEGFAEIFYYDTEGNLIGQTNIADLAIDYQS